MEFWIDQEKNYSLKYIGVRNSCIAITNDIFIYFHCRPSDMKSVLLHIHYSCTVHTVYILPVTGCFYGLIVRTQSKLRGVFSKATLCI